LDTLEKILKLIKEKEITGKKFLTDLNFDKTALSQWKKGQNESYKKHIGRIADYFGVTTDYLLREDFPVKKLNQGGFDALFYDGTDKLTGDEKEKLLDYMNFLINERGKSDDE